ncbi:OsmC family protein [Polaribacter sp.]|nr:OsmC family protein [Polaribacter sp.]
MNYNTVTTIWKENMQFESDNPSKHTLLIDAGEENGGESKGHRPKALMLSSLAGCSGLDIVSLLEKMRATVTDFKIEVTATLTDEHPKYYNKVKVDYHFTGENLKKDKIKKAVDLSVEKYCGVMEMFRQFATVTTEIFYYEV